jgi:Ni/Fe-hydrogenase subunit HybB-like protein
MSLFMILGIVLCCLHQSTLGTLMTIPMYKMNPLWFTPALPLLFLLSAAAVGLTSAVVASAWSSKAFGYPYEKALAPLARSVPVFIGIYIAARVIDLALRNSLPLMFDGSMRAGMFLVEIFAGMVLPCALLMFEKVRRSPVLLSVSCGIFILGITFNRINTYITAYQPPFTNSYYFPSAGEIFVCLAQVAAIIFLYRLIATVFPVVSRPAEAE